MKAKFLFALVVFVFVFPLSALSVDYSRVTHVYGINQALYDQIKANYDLKTQRYFDFLALLSARLQTHADIFVLEVGNSSVEDETQVAAKISTMNAIFSDLHALYGTAKPRLFLQLYASRTWITFHPDLSAEYATMSASEQNYFNKMKLSFGVFSSLDGVFIDHEESTYCYYPPNLTSYGARYTTICKVLDGYNMRYWWSRDRVTSLVNMVRTAIPRGSFVVGLQPMGQYLKPSHATYWSYPQLQIDSGLELQLIQTQRICKRDPNYESPEIAFPKIRADFLNASLPIYSFGVQISVGKATEETANVTLADAKACLAIIADTDIRKVYFYGPTLAELETFLAY